MATQKFITIYEQLKQRIHEGEYTYGQQLPSEHELLTRTERHVRLLEKHWIY